MAASATSTRRFIDLASCPNFRDFGGYEGRDGRHVRWSRLYRSMTPEYLTPEDASLARELGIGLVIDLRGPRFKTSGPLGEAPARRVVPGRRRRLVPNKQALAEYVKLPPEDALPIVLERMAKSYATAAAEIAETDRPMLVHCRLGKDRTGVFAAVLLKLLGVSDEDVIEDYMLSERCLDEVHALATSNEPGDQVGVGSRVAQEPPSREAMRRVLSKLEDEYGGAEAYLQENGLSKRRTRKLIEGLLE